MPALSLSGQTLVNRAWVAQYGLPDTVAWSASTADASGHLYTTGNTFVLGNGTDVLLTKYDPEGTLLWQQTYDHQGHNDYGVAILYHANGELTVAAALHDATDSFDVGLLRYDASGTLLWSTTYDYEGQYDVPTALAEDAQGNLYVCAASLGSSTDLDYLTLAYQSNGTLLWADSYDFAAGRDVPVSLVVDGEITVTGASEDSLGQWDFYTVMYDDAGTVLEEYRLDKPGLGFDEPAGMARDAAGNFYLTGRASDNGTEYYIQTVKLDAQLNLVWEVAYNHSGQDGATGLGLDSQGNVYVCGYLAEPMGQELLLLKYDASGNLLWDQVETAENGGPAAATHLHIDGQDQVFITGYQGVNSQQRLYVAAFDTEGKKLWARSVEDGEYLGGEILTQGTDAYVSARRFSNGSYQYVALKYAVWSRSPDVQQDSVYATPYLENELLVRFNPDLINPAFVDNPDLTFDRLGNLIPASVISAMNQQVGSGIDFATVMVEKVHKRMTRADSMSISRDGNEVRIPKFWSRLVLVLPDAPVSTVRSTYDEKAIADSLATLAEYIWYAEPQYLGSLMDIPNDPRWVDQFSLNNDPQFVNATINADPAWDVENGIANIRVGIYDSGLDWAHEDFSMDGTNTFNGSKISGGIDYSNGDDLENLIDPDPDGHGTACAGIIGALRSNNLGVAGIAGGDMTGNNAGVQLFGMKIIDDNGVFVPLATVATAIEEGAAFNPNHSFGEELDIMNHSWGTSVNSNALAEAVRFAFENQVTFVASRGNWIDNNNPFLVNNQIVFNVLTAQDDELIWPACYNDPFVINVAGTGIDGQRKIEGNGSPLPQPPITQNNIGAVGDNFLVSMRGNGVDVAAPATRSLVWTTDRTDQGNDVAAYTRFNGTSAAAPHVAGVAALMMSEQNNRGQFTPQSLAPDDIEFLVQRYAEDRGAAGIDDETGAGLLNAEAVMQNLEFPFFQVYHSDVPDTRQQTTVGTNFLAFIPTGAFDLPGGYYYVDRVQVTDSYLQVFPPTSTVLDAWPLLSTVRGISAANPLENDNWQNITLNVQANVVSATAITNAYFVRTNPAGVAINQWVPAPPADLRTGFAAHIHDPEAVLTSREEPMVEQVGIEVFPNPTHGQLKLAYTGQTGGTAQLAVFDLAGREVKYMTLGHWASGAQTHTINLTDIPAGMYLLRLSVGNESYQQRLIKR
jgi:subtilisin family serine protease